MPQVLQAKIMAETKLREGILAALAFFSLYDLPLRKRRIYELLYKCSASENDVYKELDRLVLEGRLIQKGERYSIKPWDEARLDSNRAEIDKRWKKVDKYFRILSLIPFIEHAAIIHSLAIGNADQESDIDFFIITKPGKLYFVRSLIIIIFKLLGVYKNRLHVKERFCFGYYITSGRLDLSDLLLSEDDPFMAFWFASHAPILGRETYRRFTDANRWVRNYLPNYSPEYREKYFRRQHKWMKETKKVMEYLLWLPAAILEPMLRMIHIHHTFRLPENHWPTSSTIAEKDILKLHAIDNRKELRERFYKTLQSLR
jgi:hypothetical protein